MFDKLYVFYSKLSYFRSGDCQNNIVGGSDVDQRNLGPMYAYLNYISCFKLLDTKITRLKYKNLIFQI